MRLPAGVDIKSRDGTLSRDTLLVNLGQDKTNKHRVVKRPAMWKSNVFAPTGQGFGAFDFNGTVYVWTDAGSSSGVVDESLMGRSFVYYGDAGGGMSIYEVLPDNPYEVNDEVVIDGSVYTVSEVDGSRIKVSISLVSIISSYSQGRSVYRAAGKFFAFSYESTPVYETRSVANPNYAWPVVSTSLTYANGSAWYDGTTCYFIANTGDTYSHLVTTSNGTSFSSARITSGANFGVNTFEVTSGAKNVLTSFGGVLYCVTPITPGANWNVMRFSGGSWTSVLSLGSVSGMQKVIANGSSLVVISQSGVGANVFTSSTGNSGSWTNIGTFGQTPNAYSEIVSYNSELYMVVSNGILKSTNNGVTWTSFLSTTSTGFGRLHEYNGSLVLVDPNTYSNRFSPIVTVIV